MNSPKTLGVCRVADTAEQLRELAEPWLGGEKVKAAINRAAKRCGFSYWRAFDIWYRKARRIEPYEVDAIADALAFKRKEDARNELHELRNRITRLESLLVQIDPDFHREVIAQTGAQLRPMGGTSSTKGRTVD